MWVVNMVTANHHKTLSMITINHQLAVELRQIHLFTYKLCLYLCATASLRCYWLATKKVPRARVLGGLNPDPRFICTLVSPLVGCTVGTAELTHDLIQTVLIKMIAGC